LNIRNLKLNIAKKSAAQPKRSVAAVSFSNIKYSILNIKLNKGFTLAELLIALMVTAIVLAAVGSRAYAMSKANDSSGDTSTKQAQVRSAMIRLTELIKNAKLICGTPADALVIWKADTNSDKKINSDELVYIQSNSARNQIQLIQFDSIPGTFKLADIQSGAAKTTLAPYQQSPVNLIPQCSNVAFTIDNSAIPQKSKFVSIKFNMIENNALRTHEICAAVIGPAFNLLNSSNTIVNGDDD
jgi:prepilin-type N-terminal cleavage/methylation domain-containing protein